MALPHRPWVGLQCVIVVFPDFTHLLLDKIIDEPKQKNCLTAMVHLSTRNICFG